MTTYKIEGLFSTEKAKEIKEKLDGKTFMNFRIEYGGYGTMNQTITVSTDRPDTSKKELRDMFIWVALEAL
ncbi:MAG: hypothetical protein LBI13_11235 [Streptococcaceae bacterium]|jgi:hypothetical protein|nr:hypothetical protein [Streptococcaceae bacterium]